MSIRGDVRRNKALDRIRKPRDNDEMDTKEGKLMPGKIILALKSRPSQVSAFAVPLAFGGLWLHLLHQVSGAHGRHEPLTVLHWLRDSALALPLVLIAVVIAMALSDRLLRRFHAHGSGRLAAVVRAAMSAAITSVAVVAAIPVHELLFQMETGHHGSPTIPFPVDIGRDGLFTLASLVIAGLVAVVLANRRRAHPRGVSRAARARGRRLGGIPARCVRVASAAAIAASLIPASSLVPAQPFAAAPVAAASSCAAGSADRSYDVVAINVTIPFNRWGQTDPNGQIFALKGDAAAIKNWSKPLAADPADDPAGNRRLRPRPLVLRANAGECVEVTLTNQLNATGNDGLPTNPHVSIHVNGPSYNVQTSDGSAVGYNDDTTVPMGGSITYYWLAPEEGLYFFHDRAGFAGSEADGGSNVHGLYGALAVEPAGSTWIDPVSGQPLYSGTGSQSGDLYINAVIKPMNGTAFRESIQISQDEVPGVGFGFNYGVESMQARSPEYQRCPDCISEETVLSSWPYGDPALIKLASGPGPWKPAPGNPNVEDCGLADSCYVSNVTHAYAHDPTKIRFVHAGVKETHVFHMHAHQWRAEPKDPNSTTIDSQTFGPGESFTADLLFGAGSKPGTIGDSIFHCHLYPHFAGGFWSLFRVHDVLEDGSGTTPDGIKVRALQPLPSRAVPMPTADNPGYPRFIPGEFGWRAPQPPNGVSDPSGVADNPATLEREDLKPASRIVAGKALDPTKVAIEKNVQNLHGGGKPGAPLADPCPATARQVTYNVSVIQTDIVYNEAGWHDSQGRMLVLDKDVDAVLSGAKEPEPFFFRVNAGDCVNFNLTNLLPNWIGNDAFMKLAQTNMVGQHIHLVKFDVLGSDGSSNGWNYQQAAFTKEQLDYNNALLAGTKQCTMTPTFYGDPADGCRIPDPANYDPNTTTNRQFNTGQTIHERWYADYGLRTVFTHDHHFPAIAQNRGLFGALVVEPANMDSRNPRTGEFYQPINNPANGPVCGTACEGTARGTAMDLIGTGANDDFREFSLAFQDFVLLTKPGGNPADPNSVFNPPEVPEEFPSEDPGVMGINYRNAPLLLRNTVNGTPVDPAYAFSSTVFGDPKTPLLKAYAGDPVRIRIIQGAQEEQHVFTIHGMRWRDYPDNPNSQLVNSRSLGLSDAFNFEFPREVPKMECAADEDCRGDYLYSSGGTDDLYLGMWGIFRVYGKATSDLLPLPDNIPQATNGTINLNVTGSPPAPATKPGMPCPAGVPARKYNVVAMEKDLKYNEKGDHDPYGLMYALAEDEAAIRDGTKPPEPLVLRANEGDCIEVTLTNKLTSAFLNHGGTADGDPSLPLEPPGGTKAGLRVSLHPQLVYYDVRGSDGATVGFNRDQTVGPGESILYRWYADDVSPGELGASNLFEFGDVRGHRHHGLFGGLIIEPRYASYHDPLTGASIASGASADIRVPGIQDFRDFTLFFQDGLNLRTSAGALIEDQHPHPGEAMDAEDQGEKGFNYANAPYRHRLGSEPVSGAPDGPALANVFSTNADHGDPATPLFRAYTGDAVRMRVLQGADKPRQHAFQLSGHGWKAQPNDPNSSLIGTQGGISVGRALNVHLPSAGDTPGDYRYNCGVAFFHQSGGLWGIMRVYSPPSSVEGFTPTALNAVDNPRTSGYHPIMPLEPAETTTGDPGDSTAPPAPVADPAGGTYTSPQTVSLSSEDGATIRFTLDGSDPSPTEGMGYSEPITIESSATLKAIAIDAAGNVSTMTTESYTIESASPPPSTGGTVTAAASGWTNIDGAIAAGSADNLATDDQVYLTLKAVKSGLKYLYNGYGSLTLPADQRDLSELTVTYDGGASRGGYNRTLYLFNFATDAWESVGTQRQTTSDLNTTIPVNGDPKRFVSSTGEIRMRISASNLSSFQLKADLMSFTYTYQP